MRRVAQVQDDVMREARPSGSPSGSEKELDERVMRAELDLMIDHRLGVDFPPDRREAMWEIRRRIERNRLKLVSRYLLGRLRRKGFARSLQGMAAVMAEEYAKVLSEEDLRAFLGLQPGQRPVLPLDEDQIE